MDANSSERGAVGRIGHHRHPAKRVAARAAQRLGAHRRHHAAGAGGWWRWPRPGWARSTRRCSTLASRDLLPGKTGEITTLEGETLQHRFLMGSDSFGRDIYSRVIYGTQVSLIVGVATAAGGAGLRHCAGPDGRLPALAGRPADARDGRADGHPRHPDRHRAGGHVAGSLLTVVMAIAIPEIPRVTRLVRSLVLTIREEPYVEAAISLGTPTWLIMLRHILPNTVAPLIVQGTFICASGILTEAILSFLGVGLPPDIPTWGNVMAEGRAQFNEYPHNIFFPGIFLAVTVLAVNILGDGLRDTLDPKMAKRS
jgi:peptide/nickel transport system permease protein